MFWLLEQLYRLPLIGDALCFLVYGFAILTIPFIAWLSGCQRVKCGSLVFWIPRSARKSVLEAVELLREKDPEMFLRLMAQRRLTFVYTHQMNAPNSGGRLCGLHKRFIDIGPEGIVCFLLQSLFCREASPAVNQCRLSESKLAAKKAAPRKVLGWMLQHSFDPSLINSYRRVTEKWEQSERFQ